MGKIWNWTIGTFWQIVKYTIILAILAVLGYGAYYAWVKFIKQSSQSVSKGHAKRMEKLNI